MMEEDTKELKDYLDAFRRRRTSVFLIVGVLFLVTLVVAMAWPPTYQAQGTILIEEQEVPPDLIRSTITSYASQRIETIKQRVMSRANLMEIVEKFNLYPTKRRYETTEEIQERMRKDIKVEMLTAEVVDPRSGRPTQATIAFTVAYLGEQAETTQKVANELVSLFLSENVKNRTEKTAETTSFLVAEAEKLGKDISELENKMAIFKKANAERLPELSMFNQQLVDRTERELTEVTAKLASLDERKFYLEAELARISPYGVMFGDSGEKVLDPESRLKMLRSEYLSASSRYSPDYPDVVRLKREIEGLEKQTGSVNSSSEQAKELTKLRNELIAAREKYSDDHPDVIRLTKSVAALEDAVKQESAKPAKKAISENPENPAYITLKAQLSDLKIEKDSLASRRSGLTAKLANYENRLMRTPEVERVWLDLKRDYDNSVSKYREVREKQMQAEVGQQLEKDRKGERFALIDPPQFPEAPVRPNRPAIIILGLVLSIAGGIGSVVVAESVDSSVRSVRSVTVLLRAPPLAVIPYMKNMEDLLRTEKTKRLVMIALASSFVLMVLLFHFFGTPLDVLLFKGLRKVDNVIGS